MGGKLCPAEAGDDGGAVVNGHDSLVGHGDEGILHADGILVQPDICILSSSIQFNEDVLSCK